MDQHSPAASFVMRLDKILRGVGHLFAGLCSACLLVMLFFTAATIVLRPFNLGAYWIFPWTMVLFVWLSFFGFFAAMIFARDVRIDFVARLFGERGMAATRVLGHVTVLGVVGILIWTMPQVLSVQTGKVDGALLPGSLELPRWSLTVPLALSSALIGLAMLVDVAKMVLGLPEYLGEGHSAAPSAQTAKPV
ncbi:TRAP transporter small permease [Ahrensia sp. R2A130]|uniref:TRAP transporter small permease n=1 Tax=Ahrensia sp. R2A130 TaxID=744979 RepID=UPI0001E094C9|nr:TRAP transporter small permease [Ahrensia sp. R2A130]EFL88176.1 hypothetical protein R2A130_1995 [Ahrensia sp. R2A130]